MRPRFAVESTFAVTSDALECADPFGGSITFRIHRFGSKRHSKWARERLKNDQALVRTLTKAFRRGLEEAKKRRELKVVDPDRALRQELQASADRAVEAAADAAMGVGPSPEAQAIVDTFEEQYRESKRELMQERLESGDIDVLFGPDTKLDDDRELVLALLDGWSGPGVVDGETGEAIPFTRENAETLLLSDAVVREGEHAGELLGDVLVRHLLDFAKGHTITRGKYLEAAEKNSEGSSAGA